MDVSLALGGGGSKGYAHVGVIRFLEEQGFNVRAIAGTSVGGLFGGVYAAGHRFDELQALIERLDQNRLYNRLPGDGPALMGMAGLTSILEELLGDTTFEDLPIPLAMTGVDLETGEAVVLNKGLLIDAIQATIALPGIFPPKLWEGRLVIDGGVIDPVPVTLARSLAPDLPVVAVVLTPKINAWDLNKELPFFLNSVPLLNRFYQFRVFQSLNIFLRSVDIAGYYLSEMTLETCQPEVIIRPDLGKVGLIDPVDIADLLEKGEKAARAAMPQFSQLNHKDPTWSSLFIERFPWLYNWIRKNYTGAS